MNRFPWIVLFVCVASLARAQTIGPSTNYAPTASPTFTGTVTMPDATTFGTNAAIAGNAILTAPSTGVLQHGAADVSSGAVAQTLKVQSNTGSSTTGPDFTIAGSKGTSAGGNILFQTAGTTTLNTILKLTPTRVEMAGQIISMGSVDVFSRNGGTGDITISSNAGNIVLNRLTTMPNITTDATHTDSTLCQDTTSHAIYFGSGTAGICLGTSGRQFKTAFEPMQAGLDDIVKLNLWNYRYKEGWGDGGARMQYGPTAQDVEAVLPDLARHNEKGETINYDIGAFIPISLRAIQQLKADNDDLRAEINALKRAIQR